MMDLQKMAEQMADFSKQAVHCQQLCFENTMEMISLFHKQCEQLMHRSIDQNPMIPEDGKKICSSWTEACQNNLRHLREIVNINYKKVDEAFANSEKAAAA